MKYPDKKVLNIIIIVISALILGLGVFYGTYHFFIRKSYSIYHAKVKSELINIHKINEESNNFTKGNTIDTQKILDNISNSISTLQTSYSKLKNLITADKYKDDHNTLLAGLDNNIKIYKEILNIVKDTKNKDLVNSISELQKYRDDCLNYYALISNKDLNITLPEETLELINNTVLFTQRQVRLNIDKQILITQNKDFFKSLNEMLNQFNEIKKDYTPSVLNARENIAGYDILLNNISLAESKLSNIKTSTINLNVTKEALPIYQAFTKLLSDYDLYMQNLKYAIKTEKLTVAAGISNKDSIDKLYSLSNNQLKVIDENYKSFIMLHKQFENSLSSK